MGQLVSKDAAVVLQYLACRLLGSLSSGFSGVGHSSPGRCSSVKWAFAFRLDRIPVEPLGIQSLALGWEDTKEGGWKQLLVVTAEGSMVPRPIGASPTSFIYVT